MPLAERIADIPLNGGLNTKRDLDRNDPAQSAETVIDLRCNRLGELEKRPAYATSYAITDAPNRGGSTLGISYVSGTATPIPNTVITRGRQPAILTDQLGVMTAINGEMQPHLALAGGFAGNPSLRLGYCPTAAEVSRHIVASTAHGPYSLGILATTCAVYDPGDGTAPIVVVAWSVYEYISGNAQCRIFARAYDSWTWSTVASTEVAAEQEIIYSLRACALNTTNPGVLVSYVTSDPAPYSIEAFRYNHTDRDFTSITNITNNARYRDHALLTSATAGQYYCAYVDDTSGALTVLHRTISSTAATHTATHGARAVALCTLRSGAVGIASAATGAAYTLYAERFGDAAGAVSTGIGGANETAYTITASADDNATDTDAMMVCIGVMDTTAPPTADQCHSRVVYVDADVTLTFRENRYQYWTWPHAAVSYASQSGENVRRSFVLQHTPLRDFDGAASGEVASYVLARPSWTADSDATNKITMDPVARIAHDRAYVVPQFAITYLCGPQMGAAINGHRIFTATLIDPTEDDVVGFNGEIATSVALNVVDLRQQPMPYVDLGHTTIIGGGILADFDGEKCTESQPIARPLVYVSESGPGVTQTFNVVAIFRWVDAAGNLHRSAPSAPVTATLTNETATVYAGIPAWSGIVETDLYAPAIDLYVTTDGGSTYYLAQSGGVKFVGTPITCWYTFSDVRAAAGTEPQLYSDGSSSQELTSDPPPAMHALARIGDRIWGIDAEDRARVWYTKPIAAGYAPEWNVACTLFIGDDGVAIEDVGGTPTVFGARGIWQIFGEGPNALGVGSFAPARRLPHEITCISPRVAKTPAGVAFRSHRGVMLLDVSGQLQPIGLPVELLTRVTLPLHADADWYQQLKYDERNNELRLVDETKGDFVYSMSEGKWAKWSGLSGSNIYDVAVVDGRTWVARSQSSSRFLSSEALPGETDHVLQNYGWSYETPWIRFDGVGGYVRVWRVVLQLRVPSGADLTIVSSVSAQYTTRDGAINTFTWTGSELDAEFTAQGAPADGLLELTIHPAAQKCGAFRLYITETESLSTLGVQPVNARVFYGVDPKFAKNRGDGAKRGASVPE